MKVQDVLAAAELLTEIEKLRRVPDELRRHGATGIDRWPMRGQTGSYVELGLSFPRFVVEKSIEGEIERLSLMLRELGVEGEL